MDLGDTSIEVSPSKLEETFPLSLILRVYDKVFDALNFKILGFSWTLYVPFLAIIVKTLEALVPFEIRPSRKLLVLVFYFLVITLTGHLLLGT